MANSAVAAVRRGARWLRYGLIALAALVALVIAGLAITLYALNPNDFKADIARVVQQEKQRTLAIDGDIDVWLFPAVALSLGRTRLSDRNASTEFAALESVVISVRPLPLLRNRLEVDQIQVVGARVKLLRRADGSTNFDDLIAPQKEEPSRRILFDVQGFSLRDGAVVWRDEAAGRTVNVSKVQIGTGHLADKIPTQLDFTAQVVVDQPPTDLRVAISGEAFFDLEKKTIALNKVTIDASGKAAQAESLKLSLGGDVAIDGDLFGARGFRLDANGVVAGQPLAIALRAPSFRADLRRLEISSERIDLSATGPYHGKPIRLAVKADQLSADLAAGNRAAGRGLALSLSGEAFGARLEKAEIRAPRLDVDIAARKIVAEGMELTAVGSSGEDRFNLGLSFPKLTASPESADGDTLSGLLTISGPGRVGELRIDLTGLHGNSRVALVENMGFSVNGDFGGANIKGAFAAHLEAQLEGKVYRMQRMNSSFIIDDARLPRRPMTLALSGEVEVDSATEAVHADWTTQVDESKIAAKIDVAGFADPAYRFDIALDKLNLDPYAAGAETPQQKNASAKQAPQPAEPFNFDILKQLDADGSFRIGELSLGGATLRNARFDVRARGGKVVVQQRVK